MDIVVGERIAYHDVWCGPGTEYGAASGFPLYFESDKEVLSVANSIQPDIINGLICSGDKFIASAEEINEIKSHFPDVMAVDMESATIAQVCYLKQTKVFIMRVISDTPGAEHDNSKQYENFWESAPEHTFEALAQILNKLG